MKTIRPQPRLLVRLALAVVALATPDPANANSAEPCVPATSSCSPQPDAVLVAQELEGKTLQVVQVLPGARTANLPPIGHQFEWLGGMYWTTPKPCEKKADASCTPPQAVVAWWATQFKPRIVGWLIDGEFRAAYGPDWCYRLPWSQVQPLLTLPVYECEQRMAKLSGDFARTNCTAAPTGGKAAVVLALALAVALLATRRRRRSRHDNTLGNV